MSNRHFGYIRGYCPSRPVVVSKFLEAIIPPGITYIRLYRLPPHLCLSKFHVITLREYRPTPFHIVESKLHMPLFAPDSRSVCDNY